MNLDLKVKGKENKFRREGRRKREEEKERGRERKRKGGSILIDLVTSRFLRRRTGTMVPPSGRNESWLRLLTYWQLESTQRCLSS